jgi:rod shape-determining protein MreC
MGVSIKLLRLLKSKWIIVIIITLTMLMVIALSTNQNSRVNWLGNAISIPLAPVQEFFSFTGKKIEGSLGLFKDIRVVRKENEELKAQIDQLEKEKRELERYRQEIKELRDVLSFKDQYNDFDFLGVNIIAKDPGNWFHVFTIDRGGKDGIQPDFPVITSKGLVGRVNNVWPFSAKVVSVIDEDSTVSAIISKTRDYVLVKGDITLKNQGLCKLEYIPADIDVTVGDTVETSGIGGVFPRGIIIGTIKEVMGNDSSFSKYAIITPAVDFKRLEEVVVLKSKKSAQTETGSVDK